MAKKAGDKFIRQAAQDALVRFGPEHSGLIALIRQAREDRTTGIGAARSTAQSITSAVDQARPQVTQIYNAAAGTQNRVSDQVVHDVANLTGVNPSIVAAMAVERAASTDRTSGSRAAALTDLTRQRVSAQRGKQWAIQNANQGFASTIGKVQQRTLDLANEEGAFISSETGKARQAAAERRQAMKKLKLQLTASDRNSIRASGTDPITGGLTADATIAKQNADATTKKALADAKAKKNPKPTQGDRSASSDYSKALTWATRISTSPKAKTKTKAQIKAGAVEILTTGDRQNSIPAIPQPLAQAAVEMKVDGYVSQATLRTMRRQGYRVDLLPGIRTKPPKNPPRVGKQPASPGIFGQVINQLGG